MKKTLLAVMAHPDDESFGIGGTLARYAAEGVHVHLICATGGEHGTVSPQLLEGHDSISALRESELRCAAGKLGLAGLTIAGYRDSGMAGTDGNVDPASLAAQPVENVAAHFAGIIREVRPQVVITHDPIGNYMHPDHIACQRATELAFRLAGDPEALPKSEQPAWQPARLYYYTLPKGMFKWFARIAPFFRIDLRHFGRNKDIDVIELLETGDFPIHARIDYRKYAHIRDAASACHASQLESGPPNSGPFAFIFRLFAGYDLYMRAYPEADPGLQVGDLFAGL
jgi:N-acetyl-1-D-myo-inositol-2-amino-2-deoxy-alpha-D-glucopyranoside deacetylase/mycothiol S-conjugate amidase